MEKLPCSIFNDVIGPVMRGQSSSHVAGAARIADLVRQSMKDKIVRAIVDFDVKGALASSHTGHGTDMGFACGLMGLPLSDPAVDQYERLAKERGIDIAYRILDYGAVHPGNYRIKITDESGFSRHWEAIAVGGGMIEMQKLEEFDVTICGDFYELLVICENDRKEYGKQIKERTGECDFTLESAGNGRILLNLKYAHPVGKEILEQLKNIEGIQDIMYLEPVLPTHSAAGCKVPYSTSAGLLEYAGEHPMEA